MLKEIRVSKELIINKYNKIDNFFRDCIEALFEENSDKINKRKYSVRKIINSDSNNNLSLINDCLGTVGVYCFIDKEGLPQYIGKGGTSRSSEGEDLKFRIGQELRKYSGNNMNTLSKNIITIDSILENKEITSEESLCKIKEFELWVFIIGKRINEDKKIELENIKKTEALEMLLLALIPTKYNL